jgi:tRNA/tmRNA/rRNA uracil-C5-methylase (TrmA/RlmC/RlmD family)
MAQAPTRPTIASMDTAVVLTTKMVVGGAALARQSDGRVVFVHGALPGETVKVELRSVKKDFATGDVVEVITASPDRVEPPCEAWHRGCGGCDWQHIDPPAQLPLKVDIVREALRRTGRVTDPHVIAGGSVEPWGYRTTVRVAPAADGRVGFRSRRSHDVIPIERCLVAHEQLNALIAGATAVGGDVTLRIRNDGEAAGDGVDASDAAVFEVVAGHRFRVSTESFFQSSPHAAELLVMAVRRACRNIVIAGSTVIDAYGGVGLFAATVAATAHEIVLIEASGSACADARVNLAGLPATIVHSKVEDWQPIAADLVIADPARSGLERRGAARVTATGAAVVVLVSCDAGSLGRDARLLTELGYRHDGTGVIDVFPNTSHVEAVTRFVRNG